MSMQGPNDVEPDGDAAMAFLSEENSIELGNLIKEVTFNLDWMISHVSDVAFRTCEEGVAWPSDNLADEVKNVALLRGYKDTMHFFLESHRGIGFALHDAGFHEILKLLLEVEKGIVSHTSQKGCRLDVMSKSKIKGFSAKVKIILDFCGADEMRYFKFRESVLPDMSSMKTIGTSPFKLAPRIARNLISRPKFIPQEKKPSGDVPLRRKVLEHPKVKCDDDEDLKRITKEFRDKIAKEVGEAITCPECKFGPFSSVKGFRKHLRDVVCDGLQVRLAAYLAIHKPPLSVPPPPSPQRTSSAAAPYGVNGITPLQVSAAAVETPAQQLGSATQTSEESTSAASQSPLMRPNSAASVQSLSSVKELPLHESSSVSLQHDSAMQTSSESISSGSLPPLQSPDSTSCEQIVSSDEELSLHKSPPVSQPHSQELDSPIRPITPTSGSPAPPTAVGSSALPTHNGSTDTFIQQDSLSPQNDFLQKELSILQDIFFEKHPTKTLLFQEGEFNDFMSNCNTQMNPLRSTLDKHYENR
jgi:hypothetical protein